MVVTLVLLACSSPPPAPQAPDAPPVDVETTLPPIEHQRRTNDPQQALDGLDKRIEVLYTRIAARPKEREALIASLGLRMSLTGRVSDLEGMLALGPGEGRSSALLAAHRFDEALALDPSVADSVALARQQDLERLKSEREAEVAKFPGTTNWTRLGDVRLAQGDALGADVAYASALEAYRDISPLTVADLQFRRGLAWGETGKDPERARALYTEAIRHLPQFVRANVHLAELEKDAGDLEAAVQRVRRFAEAEDPEPGGKLAAWLEGEEAETWKQKTTVRYERLLAEEPLAWSDHAAEFFLSVGEKERAAELAKLNLENRATRRARDLCERAGC